ncbi:MAG: acetylornithine deacetylase [Flavobacteriales bacterium]|nr:acetylornithine deacetylase [Flavobacteriales bacterium]|tara:strand:- start:24626 stop:25690 length:1065 start_codon:yes stop_codon:yes gene_type:complete
MTPFNPVEALTKLISIRSFSKEEEPARDFMESVLTEYEIDFTIDLNNIWAKNKHFDSSKYTILLNSHLDTVKPNKGYTKDPYYPQIEEGKLYGLGSNDAGGALVTLLGTFIHFYEEKGLPFNLVFAASAEEEISGKNGMEFLFPRLPKIDFAIVGEPTLLNIAIAEKGLMVLDCKSIGKAAHAARNEGVNAIYEAIKDINWFSTYVFPKQSEETGSVNMSVTLIKSGSQHNVIPSECDFVVDVRVNDKYSNNEVLNIIKSNVSCEVSARSTRLNSSGVGSTHLIREVAEKLNIKTYGSPTLSDQSLMPCESIKMGPGDSSRSHTANEFIYIDELEQAIPKYIAVLTQLGEELMV